MAGSCNRQSAYRNANYITGESVDHCLPSNSFLNTGVLQKYLKESRDTLLLDNVEMGAGVAMRYAKAISRLDRQEGKLHIGHCFTGTCLAKEKCALARKSLCRTSGDGKPIARTSWRANLQPKITILESFPVLDSCSTAVSIV